MRDSIFLKALHFQNHSKKTPVWLMRQAGRYLPEYQAIRKKMPFTEMQKNPEVAAEVTLQPIKRFNMDAAVIFSDILIVGDLIGKPFFFKENQGPYLKEPLNISEIAHLPQRKADEVLGHLQKAIHLTKQNLNVPLIGFAGAPFTLASYLIEGKSTKDFSKTLKWMNESPESFAKLLDILSDCVIDLLKYQVNAGCDALQIFDTWATILTPLQYRAILPFTKKIIAALQPLNIPIILFCKGGISHSQEQSRLSPQGLSLDSTIDLKTARQTLGQKVCLQGNLDPEILLKEKLLIAQETQKILNEMSSDPGFIFNLGHGVIKETPVDSVYTLLETLRKN